EACTGIIGAAWAGATYMPLNLSQPPTALAQLLSTTRLDALIADRYGAQKLTSEVIRHAPKKILLPTGGVPVCEPATTFENLGAVCNFEPKAVDADAPGYIEFTSGSTGIPKGVMIPNRGVAHFLRIMRERYQIVSEDRIAE